MSAPRILLADDEPHVLRVLRLTLEREGYAVQLAANGGEALAAIRADPPAALVTDIQMPGMDGRALCLALAQEFPERGFPVFVMTSMTAREHREWTAGLRDLEFLEKPISPRRLAERLRTHFARGRDG